MDRNEYMVTALVTVKTQGPNATWAANKALMAISDALQDHKVPAIYEATVANNGSKFVRILPAPSSSDQRKETP